jgi:hypothetical protein
VVVGGLVAWGVGEAVHAFFHTEVGRDVADAVGNAGEAVADTVGDVGEAIGDGASKAWNAVFG